MSNQPSALMYYQAFLAFVPPSIREVLDDDEEISNALGLIRDATISVGDSGPSFLTSMLERAVAECDGSERRVIVTDREGLEWELRYFNEGEHTWHSLIRENASYKLEDLEQSLNGALLQRTARAAIRLGGLDNEDADRLALLDNVLPIGARATAISEALKATPEEQYELANRCFRERTLKPALFPTLERYYERLVGLRSYPETLTSLVSMLKEESSGHGYQGVTIEGLRWILLRSGHASIIPALVPDIGRDVLLGAWSWMHIHGDLFSIIGLIENSLRLYPDDEPISREVRRAIDELMTDDPDGNDSRFRLTSHLIVWSESQIISRGLLATSPPYWRRWAAIAHAGLLEQAIRSAEVPVPLISQAIEGQGWHTFFLNGLLDLRTEPRWMPEFMMPPQLKSELLSRIVNAGRSYLTRRNDLYGRIVDENTDSVAAQMEFPKSFLPGPLEGNVPPDNEVPPEVLARLACHDGTEAFNAADFAGLVNTCTVFRVTSEHSHLAQKVLRSVRDSIAPNFHEKDRLALVLGLARVAASARDDKLADEVRILSRVVRRLKTPEFASEEMRVALTAAAAHSELGAWIAYVDRWLVEMATELSTDHLQSVGEAIAELAQLAPPAAGAFSRARSILAARTRAGSAT